MPRKSIGAAGAALLLLASVAGSTPPPGTKLSEYDVRYGYSEHYGVVTPRDVFALATNFNAVLDYYFQTHNADRLRAARTLAPTTVTGKQPADLLARSQRLADLVDRLAEGSHLSPVLRIDRAGESVLPAESYLQVGASLDGLIFYLSALDASQVWGDYYVTLRYPDEKTLNDAYAVIDLAVRKLELATTGATKPHAGTKTPRKTTSSNGPTAAGA